MNSLVKSFQIIIVVFIILLVNIKCEKQNKEIARSAKYEELQWFIQDQNYDKKASYYAAFNKEYDQLIESKKFEDAKQLLFNSNVVVYDLNIIDSLVLNKTLLFFDQKYPVAKDSVFCMLNYYTANQYSIKNNPKKCIYYLNEAENYNKKVGSETISRLTQHYLGMSYTDLFEYQKALKNYTSVLKLHENAKDYANMGSVYYSMGNIHDKLNAPGLAETFFKNAAVYFKKANDLPYYFLAQATFAEIQFNKEKDTVKTINFIDNVVNEFKSFKKSSSQDSVQINNLRSLKYLLIKSYDSAFFYNNKSIAYYKTNKNDFDLVPNLQRDIEIYFRKYKKLKDVNVTEQMARDFAEQKSYSNSATLYNMLYENAKTNNNFKDALKYTEKENEIRDLILRQNHIGQLFEFDKKYQSEKKEKQIAKQQVQISKNNSFIFVLVIALIMIVLGTILYFSRKRKLEAQAETKRQEQFTFQLLQNTEEERNRIANELHDSVNHDLLNIKNTLINGKNIEVKTVENVIEEVRNISKNLHPAVLQNIGFEASIESLCERLTNEAGLFTTCDIEYEKKLSRSKELQLYRIIQEALNNTLKHGKANAAKVIVVSSESKLHVEIKDNGNGFNVTEQMSSSKSFGLQSILQRAKAIAAKINIESSEKGTKISLNINF